MKNACGPELKKIGSQLPGWILEKLLPLLTTAHGDELISDWLASPDHYAWDWENVVPLVINRTFQSAGAHETALGVLEEALNRFPGPNYQKGEELRVLVGEKRATLAVKKARKPS